MYPKDAAPLLYPIWSEGCHDPVFEAGLDAPDPDRHPAALLARGFECILEAGKSRVRVSIYFFYRGSVFAEKHSVEIEMGVLSTLSKQWLRRDRLTVEAR